MSTSALTDLLEDYLNSRPNLRPKTVEEYRRSFRRFSRLYPTRADLTSANVGAYTRGLLERGKRHLAHKDAQSLCLFSRWLVEAGRAPTDPLAGFRIPPQPNTRRQPFKDEDLPKIVQAASRGRTPALGARNAAIVVLALASGLRCDEMRRLRWPEDVDLDRHFVYVRSGKTDAAERVVLFDPLAVRTLTAYLADRTEPGPLFRREDAGALSYGGFRSIFAPIKKRLNGVDFKIHRARNTAITNWLRAETDLYTVMQLAGHRNPKVTIRYAGKLNEDDLVRLVRPGLSRVLPA